jgi:hypothetical protein
MEYLLSLGVAPARIKTTSYGEELPMCKDSTENCYEKNRRPTRRSSGSPGVVKFSCRLGCQARAHALIVTVVLVNLKLLLDKLTRRKVYDS